MWWLLTCTLLLAPSAEKPKPPASGATVIVVVGEPGEANYEELFTEWAERWKTATEKSSARFVPIGWDHDESSDQPDRVKLEQTLAQLSDEPPQSLWLVLIGHGTFDGKKAKFNLRGTDISAAELAPLLSSISCRMAIINCASSSGPFVNPLSAADRVVVTATQSGFEYNFARFGGFLSQAIGDTSGDLDKDGQTSLLEAWLAAAKQTQSFYESESRLATEHALLDDNGDGKGTPADWFRGIYVTKASKDGAIPDGTLANQFILVPGEHEAQLSAQQLQKRDELEQQLAQLRQQKSDLSEEDYLRQLREILIPLARLYQSAEPDTGDDAQPEASADDS